mgnify:CR=1 FL=1
MRGPRLFLFTWLRPWGKVLCQLVRRNVLHCTQPSWRSWEHNIFWVFFIMKLLPENHKPMATERLTTDIVLSENCVFDKFLNSYLWDVCHCLVVLAFYLCAFQTISDACFTSIKALQYSVAHLTATLSSSVAHPKASLFRILSNIASQSWNVCLL